MQTDPEAKPVGDASAGPRGVMRILRLLPLWFMAAIVFVTYAGIIWTLRRGFGWGDESFAYTMIASNRKATGEAWGFQYLLHPLYVLTGESVLAFRVLRLAGYVLLSLGLVWTARFVTRRAGISIRSSGWVFILLLAQVGTFLAWSYPPRYLSYNELSAWLTQAGVALILISLAWGASSPGDQQTASPADQQAASPGDQAAASPGDHRASSVLWAIWAGLGGLTALLVFAKVTSAAAFGAVLALALVVPNPYLRFWKRLLSAAAGATAVLLTLWLCRVPVVFYFRNTYSLFFDTSVRDAFAHPTANMIAIYQNSLLFTVRALGPAVLLFILAMVTLRWKARPTGEEAGEELRHRLPRWSVDLAAWVLGVLLLLALMALRRRDTWSYLGELVVFIGAAGIIGLAIQGADWEAVRRTRLSRSFAVAVGGAAIVATPFISALGTNNRLTGQFVFAATLWAVVLGIALVLLARRAALLRSRARSLPVLVGCAVTLLAASAVRADILTPYGTAPLLSQGVSTSAPELRGLLLTRNDAAFVSWVSAAGDSLDAQDVPSTAINSAGALFAFNHSGYANPWVGRDWPAAYNSLRIACSSAPPTDLFVLQPGTSQGRAQSIAGVTKNLAACGIRFPADFQVVAQGKFSDRRLSTTIWRLKPGAGAKPGNGAG